MWKLNTNWVLGIVKRAKISGTLHLKEDLTVTCDLSKADVMMAHKYTNYQVVGSTPAEWRFLITTVIMWESRKSKWAFNTVKFLDKSSNATCFTIVASIVLFTNHIVTFASFTVQRSNIIFYKFVSTKYKKHGKSQWSWKTGNSQRLIQ